MLNFMKLRDYPLDIDEFNHDVSSMVDRIYVGPQGELLSTLDNFNQTYQTDLEITKNFTLKPGGYDKLKKAYSRHVLRWDMKPRGITSIFNRITEYRWRGSNIQNDAIRLETQMAQLRSSGILWQDNSEDFVHETEKLKDIIADSIEVCSNLYPNIDISVKVMPSTLGRMNTQSRRYASNGRDYLPEIPDPTLSNPVDYILVFYVHMKDPEMTVHILMGDDQIDTYTFPCHDIVVASGTYLLPMISRNWGRSTLRTDSASTRNYSYFLEAMYLSPFGSDQHPYIGRSADLYTWDLDQHIGNPSHVCTGNMSSEIRNTLLNSQIEAHITYLVTWLTNYYVPQTNPLNRVSTMRSIGYNKPFNVYASEGHVAFDTAMNLDECVIGSRISMGIERHASGNVDNRYSTTGSIWSTTDPEYIARKKDYIASIDTKDLPCHDCVHMDECSIKTNVFTFLQDEAYTPMEEAYIGMFIEIAQHHLHTGARNRNERYYFAEEAILWSDYCDPSEFYNILVECNICVQRWYFKNGEEPNMNWSSERFKLRFSAILRKSTNDRKALLEHALSDKSEFVWTLDNIDRFLHTVGKLKHPTNKPIEEVLPEPSAESFEEVLEMLDDIDDDSEMTAEQRTLQWATTMGGSTNL